MLKKLLPLLLIISANFAYAETAPTFSINTNAFLDAGIMPVLYTCDGKDDSPQFSIKTPPAKTKSFAFIMNDPTAPKQPFYHWVVFNLPGNTTELKQGLKSAPSGSLFGINSFDKAGYNGPCPPQGTTHTYQFTLYALDTNLTLGKTATGDALETAMKGHILGQAKFSGVYSRWLTPFNKN